jgi:predicted aspartyl protease
MATGYIQKGDAYVEIELTGAVEQGKKFRCLIDTGFSGFLAIPLAEAFPLGLILQGTTSFKFADGTTHEKLIGYGKVSLGSRTEVGSVVLEPQGWQALLGLGFLRSFELGLVLDVVHESVTLTPVRKTRRP